MGLIYHYSKLSSGTVGQNSNAPWKLRVLVFVIMNGRDIEMSREVKWQEQYHVLAGFPSPDFTTVFL